MDTAREIAEELNQDNIRRRELEIEIFQQADEMTRQQIDFMNERAIVVCGEGWNPGVIGLAAALIGLTATEKKRSESGKYAPKLLRVISAADALKN